MDCEWTATRIKNKKPNVALLQIATADGCCFLFRTCFMNEVPASLSVSIIYSLDDEYLSYCSQVVILEITVHEVHIIILMCWIEITETVS